MCIVLPTYWTASPGGTSKKAAQTAPIQAWKQLYSAISATAVLQSLRQRTSNAISPDSGKIQMATISKQQIIIIIIIKGRETTLRIYQHVSTVWCFDSKVNRMFVTKRNQSHISFRTGIMGHLSTCNTCCTMIVALSRTSQPYIILCVTQSHSNQFIGQ